MGFLGTAGRGSLGTVGSVVVLFVGERLVGMIVLTRAQVISGTVAGAPG
jgi:hypothetical protein